MYFDVSVGNTINITQLMNHLSSCLYLFLPTFFFSFNYLFNIPTEKEMRGK